MAVSEQEKTIKQAHIHWGVFSIALMPLLVVIPVVVSNSIFNAAWKHMSDMIPIPVTLVSTTPAFWLIISVPILLLVVGLLLVAWVAYSKSEVRLTNRRLVYRAGLIAFRSGQLPLENVEGIFMSQSVLGRLFGYGTVTVASLGGHLFPFRFIDGPAQFHDALQEAVSTSKNKAPSNQKPPQSGADDSRYMPKS
jgi:hypothetical protein